MTTFGEQINPIIFTIVMIVMIVPFIGMLVWRERQGRRGEFTRSDRTELNQESSHREA